MSLNTPSTAHDDTQWCCMLNGIKYTRKPPHTHKRCHVPTKGITQTQNQLFRCGECCIFFEKYVAPNEAFHTQCQIDSSALSWLPIPNIQNDVLKHAIRIMNGVVIDSAWSTTSQRHERTRIRAIHNIHLIYAPWAKEFKQLTLIQVPRKHHRSGSLGRGSRKNRENETIFICPHKGWRLDFSPESTTIHRNLCPPISHKHVQFTAVTLVYVRDKYIVFCTYKISRPFWGNVHTIRCLT